MKNYVYSCVTVFTIAMFISSCEHEPIVSNVVCDPSTYAYNADIKPIMDAHCTSCHREGATVSNGHIYLEDWAKLNDYLQNDPEGFIGSIKHDPAYDDMPKDAAKLSDCEITKIEKWMAAGALNN